MSCDRVCEEGLRLEALDQASTEQQMVMQQIPPAFGIKAVERVGVLQTQDGLGLQTIAFKSLDRDLPEAPEPTVWHNAVATIFTRTSPGPGGDTVTVVTSSFFLESQAIAALQSIGFPAVAATSAMARTRTTTLREGDLFSEVQLRTAEGATALTAQGVPPTHCVDARASIAPVRKVIAQVSRQSAFLLCCQCR